MAKGLFALTIVAAIFIAGFQVGSSYPRRKKEMKPNNFEDQQFQTELELTPQAEITLPTVPTAEIDETSREGQLEQLQVEQQTARAEITLPTVPTAEFDEADTDGQLEQLQVEQQTQRRAEITLPTVTPKVYYLHEQGEQQTSRYEITLPTVRSSSADLSEQEVQADLDQIRQVVHKEEVQVGHKLTDQELERVEEKLEQKPWYQRFGSWLTKTYHSTANSITDFLGKREEKNGYRAQRGYPDFYHMYSN